MLSCLPLAASGLSSNAWANQIPDDVLTSDDLDQIDPNLEAKDVATVSRFAGSPDFFKSGDGPVSPEEIKIAEIQTLLDRAGLSPGAINGKRSEYFERLLQQYQAQYQVKGLIDDPSLVEDLLGKSGGAAFETYELTAQDIAGPFATTIPSKIQDQGGLPKLHFQRVEEAIAERFHMDEAFLIRMNQEADFSKAGTRLRVVRFGRNVDFKVSKIVADQLLKQVTAFDRSGKILAIYPASIGSQENPSPRGNFTVRNKAGFPAYTLAPDNGFEVMTTNRQIVVAPGPNNPVGVAWIGLSKRTYGIHGTPEPSSIGQAESHGCIRLTNWDALELAKLVSYGVEVIIN